MNPTNPLFLEDAYIRDAKGTVRSHTPEGGIVLDESIFYATSGGQPGDSGKLVWDGGQIEIATCVKGEGGGLILVPAEPAALPPLGAELMQHLEWDRRHRHMRVHTALHLLSVAIPLPVTGGSITAEKGRLDFDMPDAPEDKAQIEATLNDLVAADYPVTDSWITDRELAENPQLIKTMSVKPPVGAGFVRLVRIGDEVSQIDLQPCGGTHVASTGEVGPLRLGKIEKKGRQNRRVSVFLDT
ncbi:alanyl-tRNA editing protein [Algirhabdus cladophorae]|uniref:alanyl-tRNA editing protein n=1 Tax=Algirhabdus cladophorae TaxID=3377108 RepID=UPI003B84920D